MNFGSNPNPNPGWNWRNSCGPPVNGTGQMLETRPPVDTMAAVEACSAPIMLVLSRTISRGSSLVRSILEDDACRNIIVQRQAEPSPANMLGSLFSSSCGSEWNWFSFRFAMTRLRRFRLVESTLPGIGPLEICMWRLWLPSGSLCRVSGSSTPRSS
jgi:hypothetical protein